MPALTGGESCMKYFLILFNFVFWLAGIAVLAGGLWLRFEPNLEVDYTGLGVLGVYILVATGALSMVVGFLGCCGAIKESPCMLGLFFFFLLVIFVGLVAAGIWGFFNINIESCTEAVEICNLLYIIGGVGIGAGLMTIIGMVFSMRLCCVIKRSQYAGADLEIWRP